MNAELLLAHYERISDSPDAIARLRRFILDLAVRGKIFEGFGDAEAPLGHEAGTSATADGATWSVPSHWDFVPLQHLARPEGLFTDGDWVESKDQDPMGGIRLTQLADVGVGEYRDRSSRFMNEATAERLNCTFLKSGDLLIARMPDPLGRACIFPGDAKPCVTVVDVAVLRLGSSEFDPAYVTYVINSPPFSRNVEAKAAGSTRRRISRGNLARLPVPLPSLNEQRGIVEKVNELMALCDRLEMARAERETARDRLAAGSLARLIFPDPDTLAEDARFACEALPALTARPDQIKQLRRTILNLGVQGKLVPQDSQDDPANRLINLIEADKGNEHGKTKGASKAAANDAIGSERPFPAPIGWAWMTAEELTQPGQVITYGILKPVWKSEGVPTVRVTEMKTGTIEVSALPKCDATRASLFSRTTLAEGDLLISKDGTIGKTAFVPAALVGGNITQHVLRFPVTPRVDRHFIRLAIDSPPYQAWMAGETKGLALQGVNVGDFRRMPLPIPPLAEQRRIVARVDELMALCDQLEASLNAAATTRCRLLDALLTETLHSQPDEPRVAAK